MKKFTSLALAIILVLSLSMNSFAADNSFSSQKVFVDRFVDTDGKEKILELYENSAGRTSYLKDLNGNIECTVHVDFNEPNIAKLSTYDDIGIKNTSIIPLAKYNRKYTNYYSLAQIADAGGKVITAGVVIALIIASEGGATVITSSIKKQLKTAIISLTSQFLDDWEGINNHGISVKFRQYSTYVYHLGKKEYVVKTKAIGVGTY